MSLGIILITILAPFLGEKEVQRNMLWFCVAPLIQLTLFFYTIRKFYQRIPSIRFNQEFIYANKKKYKLKEITKIDLLGKYKYIKLSIRAKSLYREGMQITFEDNDKLTLINEFYLNLNDLKIALNKGPLESGKFDKGNLNEPHIFNNSMFRIVRGYILAAFIVYFINRINRFSDNLWGIVIFSTLLILTVIYHSRLLNYFIIYDDSIIVKRKIQYWFIRKYHMNDIYEVVLDYYTTPPYHKIRIKQLRIVMKDFSQITYPTSLLKSTQWESLQNLLIENNIKIRDDRNLDYT